MAERKRILLVEDNEINEAVVIESLYELPYDIDVAATGAEGVSKFEQGQYDLVVMDLQLPGMDGYETVAQIRAYEAREGKAHTPIMAATANAYRSDRERCLASGMDDYLSKPFDLGLFVRRVAHWTGNAYAD